MGHFAALTSQLGDPAFLKILQFIAREWRVVKQPV